MTQFLHVGLEAVFDEVDVILQRKRVEALKVAQMEPRLEGALRRLRPDDSPVRRNL